MAADGAFAVTWSGSSQDPDGGASVREFTRSGTPVGGQFLAHGEAGRPRATSAVAIGAGIFAVSWSEREASPSVQDDVFVRRFRRRVIFTDDFESEDLLYWTLVGPP
jgi:hypothetical protein